MLTKQGAIREGIDKLLSAFAQKMERIDERQDEELLTNSMMRKEWGIAINGTVDEMFNYLHSQGVVIKVDRELPRGDDLPIHWCDVCKFKKTWWTRREGECSKCIETDCTPTSLNKWQHKAGYVAAEPLIEEG